MSSVKTFLKRGALVAAANWHVVLIQVVADALFKTLLAVPVVGGVFLVVLLVGGDPADLLALPAREVLPAMAAILLAQPVALAAFLFALMLVAMGGSLLMFYVKGGTVTVLVAADRAAGAIEHPPLRLAAFHRATQFTLERFTGGAAHLFRRYLVLGACLMIVYGVSTATSIAIVFGPAPDTGAWATAAAVASLAFVAWITIVNLLYLLCQIVVATEDCGVREAATRVARLLRREPRTLSLIFAATLAVVILTTAASILATAALGLIAFVPFIGLAALPLQVIAWLLRGIVFQYIGLSALVAYLRAYRTSMLREERPGGREVRTIGRSA